jgi:hypothetical protein
MSSSVVRPLTKNCQVSSVICHRHPDFCHHVPSKLLSSGHRPSTPSGFLSSRVIQTFVIGSSSVDVIRISVIMCHPNFCHQPSDLLRPPTKSSHVMSSSVVRHLTKNCQVSSVIVIRISVITCHPNFCHPTSDLPPTTDQGCRVIYEGCNYRKNFFIRGPQAHE